MNEPNFAHVIINGGLMKRRNGTLLYSLSFLLLLCFAFSFLPVDVEASAKSSRKKTLVKKYASIKKKRIVSHRKHRARVWCNVIVGRMQALAYLQSNRELAALASLEYKPDPNLQQFLDNDSELLSDNDGFADDMEGESDESGVIEDVDNPAFKADLKSFQKLWLSYMRDIDGADEENEEAKRYIAGGAIEKKDIMNHIMSWIGTPYYYGGVSRSGIDCSAFTQSIFRGSGDIALPRSAAQQSTVGGFIKGSDLRFGDLVFFNTRRAVYVSHVGVYLGDNLFAHSSSRYGVTVSSLQANYYKTRFLGGKRIRPEDLQTLTVKKSLSSSLPSRTKRFAGAE